MLKRMVPYNASFKSNTKQQVILTWHGLSLFRLQCSPPLLPHSPFLLLPIPQSLISSPLGGAADLPLTLFFQYPCIPPPASLPLGPVVLPLHDCTRIDLECTNSIVDRHSRNACVVWPELALVVFLLFTVHCCRPANQLSRSVFGRIVFTSVTRVSTSGCFHNVFIGGAV